MSRCLPGRKRHYFGRENGHARGMGIPHRDECVWCGQSKSKPKKKAAE